MKAKKLLGILSVSIFLIVGLMACDNEDEPAENTVSAKMYDVNHGKTNLADMNVYLNSNNEFYGLQNTSITLMGNYQSLQETEVSSFKDNLSSTVEVGKCYAATSLDNMTFNFNTYAIPFNEKYIVFAPVSSLQKDGVTIGYEVKYELRTAKTYNLPEWWSTVAVLDRTKENEAVITLPSADCEVFTFGQIDGVPQISLNKVTDKLKISLIDYPNHKNLNGKIELFLRIKESYSLVYVEIK